MPVASGPLAGGHSSLKVASDVTPLTRATLQVSGDGPGTPVVFSGPTQTTAASIPHVAVAPLGSVPPTIESSDPRTKPVLAKEVSANHRPSPPAQKRIVTYTCSRRTFSLSYTHTPSHSTHWRQQASAPESWRLSATFIPSLCLQPGHLNAQTLRCWCPVCVAMAGV